MTKSPARGDKRGQRRVKKGKDKGRRDRIKEVVL